LTFRSPINPRHIVSLPQQFIRVSACGAFAIALKTISSLPLFSSQIKGIETPAIMPEGSTPEGGPEKTWKKAERKFTQ
jgi:hypothetical protein